MAAAAFYEIRALADNRFAFRLRSKTNVLLVTGEPVDADVKVRDSVETFRRCCLSEDAYSREDTEDGGCRFVVRDPATGERLAHSERFASRALMEAHIKLTQLAGLAGQLHSLRVPTRASAL